MSGQIKVLGLAFVVIAAITATAASAVQASSLDIGSNPAVFTSTNESGQTFTYTLAKTNGGGNFNAICTSSTFVGTTQGQTIQDATVTPTFSGCTLFGQASTVLFNGCKFTLTGEGQAANTLQTDINGCTLGKSIQIKSALCTLDIPEQIGLSHLVGINVGGASKEVTLSATVSKVTVTQTGAACPDGNNHHSNNISFTFNWIVKAFKEKENRQITTHGHQYIESICGEQVTLVST